VDIVIVGAGAAGLTTAILTRRASDCRTVLVDGARRPGAKILVSGGGRCNVSNARVTERDFHGGSRAAIRQVLKAWPVAETVRFFADIGVSLHEEERGKLFPDSNRARDVLDALLHEGARVGVERRDGWRVHALRREGAGFMLDTSQGSIAARMVVLAAGGQSLPKSGSDGSGWTLARSVGHTIVPPVPALVPLVLSSRHPLAHAALSGIAHDVELQVWLDGRLAERVCGPLLWTHFGISGPAALDVSRHWTRATAAQRQVAITLNCCPGEGFEQVDSWLTRSAGVRPKASISSVLAARVPAAIADALLNAVDVPPDRPAGQVSREQRRAVVHALSAWLLPIEGTRGYNYAEVTAGGVDLAEINPRTMESRLCPGLFFAGEVVDVDGRLGGFNFQWAWASAAVAARALAQATNHSSPAARMQ